MELNLEDKTLAYWKLSQCWLGGPDVTEEVTTQFALGALTKICDNLNPARPLSVKVFILRDEIIVGGKRVHG